jgi:hypothetical protein
MIEAEGLSVDELGGAVSYKMLLYSDDFCWADADAGREPEIGWPLWLQPEMDDDWI